MPSAIYDSAVRSLRLVEEVRELWDFRHLVIELARRDILVRYKRSVLGMGWTMLSPLLQMIAMSWVFSVILRQGIVNYPVYFLTGSVFWSFFAQATGHAASLTQDANEMCRRAFVPRSVFVLAAVCVALVHLVLSLVPLVAIVLVTGYPVHVSWLFLPLALALGVLFTTGVGLSIFTLASRFVDIRETYLILLQLWFFVTPIVYTPTLVPDRYLFVVRYNPMTYLVEIFRAPLYNGWLPGINTITFAAFAAVLSLAIGWLLYAAKAEEYGERL